MTFYRSTIPQKQFIIFMIILTIYLNLDLNKTLLDCKINENNLIYHVAHKVTYGIKPLHITFNETDAYIRKYDEVKYIRLFSVDEKHEKMFDRIEYFISQENNTGWAKKNAPKFQIFIFHEP